MYSNITYIVLAGNGVVQWLRHCATTGGSRVRLPMVSLIFDDIILLIALWHWGRLSL
jgi:hypothetical protein